MDGERNGISTLPVMSACAKLSRMRFRFPHSHAFQRGRLAVDTDDEPGPTCTIEFGDGSVVIGECRKVEDAFVLSIPRYVTAKGTDVEPKRWRIVRSKDGVWRSERM